MSFHHQTEMAQHNMSWVAAANEPDEHALQVRPMGLKIHYSFDRDNQINCLARWPHALQVQTVPLDERTVIGVVDLRTCLQAVANCSPELVSSRERDYTIYAYDYSEPDTPLVGQGMLSWVTEQQLNDMSPPQLVTGRVTKNVLAIFGNGIRETLEVKFKFRAVPKMARPTPGQAPSNNTESFPSLPKSASTVSESAEWNSFIQSAPSLGHMGNVSTITSPHLPPTRPVHLNYEARNEVSGPGFYGSAHAPMSRPPSRPPSCAPSRPPSRPSSSGEPNNARSPSVASYVPLAPAGPISAPIAAPIAPSKNSRPSSRTSTRVPTGRPRGRPRKKQLPVPPEGSTSGYEDGTDADDAGPPKKRAKTTKVEKSNSATFGSAPESLRVAASTAGSLRNFRPVAPPGSVPAGTHLQDGPRAPTPVPEKRLSGLPQPRAAPPSSLRRQSTASQGTSGSFTTSYMELNRSMSQGQDARSPVDSISPSPAHMYSDGPSPDDIGSSPPMPRSARYDMHSSPAPSSPVLPPMPAPQLDSGFMSGGIEDSRVEEEQVPKSVLPPPPPPPVAAKPKPKRVRTKKQTQGKEKVKGAKFIIHTEVPGPPENLPRESLYNPPTQNRKNPETTKRHAVPAPTKVSPALPLKTSPELPATQPIVQPIVQPIPLATTSPEPKLEELCENIGDLRTPFSQNEGPREDSGNGGEVLPSTENQGSQDNMTDIERELLLRLNDEQDFMDSRSVENHGFAMDGHDIHAGAIQTTIEHPQTHPTETSEARGVSEETANEPELPPPVPPVPASDPVLPRLTLPTPVSEAEPEAEPHPLTDFPELEGRSNKNYVKKQAIKQKLEEAIANGQMPPYCNNCGAIQTPTWRKIWKQEHTGVPEYHEYSEKPGHVTAINILDRDESGKPNKYEMIKKTLGSTDDRKDWIEILLCNPCGIWFSKWKAPRPQSKWEKDQDRLDQVRKKRSNNGSGQTSKPKKSRAKSDSQPNPTSEACLPTDPLGPLDTACSPRDKAADPFGMAEGSKESMSNAALDKGIVPRQSTGSTHSRGSGRTPGSPIALDDDDLGSTRRLLFPSPRKEGEQRVLGEVAVNIVHTSPDFSRSKEGSSDSDKENNCSFIEDNDFVDLFGTPPARPTTPPPKSGSSGPFKTPTRPTPSHRPITRSVTKSIRSSSKPNKSPSQVILQRTPSRTPHSSLMSSSSVARRRTPRNGNILSHLDDAHMPDSPFTRSINQLLSEANDFMGPPSHHEFDIDLSDLPHMEDCDGNLAPGVQFDFGALLSTDGVMPSSPPILRNAGSSTAISANTFMDLGPFDNTGTADLWKHLTTIGSGLNLEAGDETAADEAETDKDTRVQPK